MLLGLHKGTLLFFEPISALLGPSVAAICRGSRLTNCPQLSHDGPKLRIPPVRKRIQAYACLAALVASA